MMTGAVSSYEAIVPLTVCGQEDRGSEVDAVIDTGFTGYLTLPAKRIKDLGLRYISGTIGTLADGSTTAISLYEAEVVWNGSRREVLVAEAEGGVLLGMQLLSRHRLIIDVEEGGRVSVEALEP